MDYGDTKSARARLSVELKKQIEINPLFHDKLQFPTLANSRLRTLINQSCVQPNGAPAPAPVTNSLMDLLPRVGGYPSMGGPVPFQHAPAITTSLAGWMANPSSVPHQAVSLGTTGITPPTSASDFEHLLNRSRPFGAPEEVNNLLVDVPVVFLGQNHAHSTHSADDLPKNVVANLNQGSAV